MHWIAWLACIAEVGEYVIDTVFVGFLLRGFQAASDQPDDLDTVDVPDSVEVFDAERTDSCHYDFHVVSSSLFRLLVRFIRPIKPHRVVHQQLAL
jgi:hypothetical protein